MSIAIIGILLAACVVLFKRGQETRSENLALKGQIASLKRQLARHRA